MPISPTGSARRAVPGWLFEGLSQRSIDLLQDDADNMAPGHSLVKAALMCYRPQGATTADCCICLEELFRLPGIWFLKTFQSEVLSDGMYYSCNWYFVISSHLLPE